MPALRAFAPDRRQLLGVKFSLSALEQGPLLEPDLVSQSLPELPQRLRSDARARRKVAESAAQIGVVIPDALDIRVSGTRAGGQGRKQQLLLLAEVLLAVAIPKLDRRAPARLGVGLGGAPQSQRELERDVMLSREKGKLGAALHRAFLQSGSGVKIMSCCDISVRHHRLISAVAHQETSARRLRAFP
ncbi:MAG: hypothetical protein M3Y09_01520 [Actinomycetota bacterium]|nr:hypothetical protein [Actinomycetota bacterium]